MTKLDFDDAELKDKLRSVCIDSAVPPEDFNKFFELIDSFTDKQPLAKQVFETCTNPQKYNECRILISLPKLFEQI